MSRPIKFRCWDDDRKQMEYRDFKTLAQFGWPLQDTRQFVVMLSTGLLDRQGREVYEGDRLRFNYEEDLSDGVFEGTVEWSEDGFWRVMIESHGFSTAIFSDKISEIEILGNIYEQPELVR